MGSPRQRSVDTTDDLDFAAFYREHRVHTVGRAYLLCRSQAAAEDLAQDAMLALRQHWHHVDNPNAYLRTTLVNLCMRWSQRQRMAEERTPRIVDVSTQPEIDETWQALALLPPDQHTVLVLRFYEDLSQEEIAQITGVPIGTVKSRIARGLRRLEEVLEL